MSAGLLLLTVDRGNTTLDCRLSDGSTTRRERLPADAAALRAFLDRSVPAAAVGLSVVERGLDPVREVLEPLGVPLRVAGVDLRCPLQLAYPDPATLGTDRWVGAVAARARHGDALVVDCGTAVTFNVVTRDGRFLGGAIGAGLGTTAGALAARAPVLPAFDGLRPVQALAVTSRDAVRVGVGRGFACLVEGLGAELLAEAGLPDAVRVVTGGDAEALLTFCATGFRHVPDLVHEGLACLMAPTSGC